MHAGLRSVFFGDTLRFWRKGRLTGSHVFIPTFRGDVYQFWHVCQDYASLGFLFLPLLLFLFGGLFGFLYSG